MSLLEYSRFVLDMDGVSDVDEGGAMVASWSFLKNFPRFSKAATLTVRELEVKTSDTILVLHHRRQMP